MDGASPFVAGGFQADRTVAIFVFRLLSHVTILPQTGPFRPF